MNKKQSLYPIPELDTDLDFALLARFDERNLVYLQEDYLQLPNNKIIPPLMRLEARTDIMDNPVKRSPYRAGVIAGSIIMRARLHSMIVPPNEVFTQDVIGDVAWRTMRTSRFALRQYFAEGVDVKRHLYEAVELPWALQNSTFVDPDALKHELHEDWMAIGLGDALRLGEIAYSRQSGLPLSEPMILGTTNDSLPGV